MKYKIKRLWLEYKDWILVGIAFLLLFCLFMIPLWANHKAEKNNPKDSTSDKGIVANTFEYKGHQYILFEKTNVFGPISVVHDPDCCKMK